MYIPNENSTQHGLKTPYGSRTPHKFPSLSSVANIMSKLASQLYPTGRAFYMPKGGIADKTHIAFNRGLIRIVDDANSTIDSCFPDNANFTIDDCTLWEYRLGITTDLSSTLLNRKLAIYRRMGRGRNVLARQHKNYLEYQLQTAGFEVYVFENGFIEGGVKVYKSPEQVIRLHLPAVQHGGDSQHGIGLQHGGGNSQIIANSYKPDESYSVASDKLWATFFIGGEVLGSMATIPQNREEEFRELVLKLKPAHLVAFTFISYI